MTEEHKNKIRAGVAKRMAEKAKLAEKVGLAPVKPCPEPAKPPAPGITPRQRFTAWMATNQGKDASDPRFPSDYGRMRVELEDRLFMAFTAGGNPDAGIPVTVTPEPVAPATEDPDPDFS